MDRPSCRNARKHMKICCALFMTFPWVLFVRKFVFLLFVENSSPTDRDRRHGFIKGVPTSTPTQLYVELCRADPTWPHVDPDTARPDINYCIQYLSVRAYSVNSHSYWMLVQKNTRSVLMIRHVF